MVVVIAPSQGGKMQMSDWQRKAIADEIRRLDGQDVRMEVKKDIRGRTQRQNRYYWGVVLTYIAAETGHSTEEIHEVMKQKYLPRSHVLVGTEEHEVSKSTTVLSTEEFTAYIEQVRAFAAQELSILIPSPEESTLSDGNVNPHTGEVRRD